MTTVLQARSRRFVSTPTIERIAIRALRYLQSGFSVHLRGPAGTGKTTLALHLADLLSRPIMLVFGDDDFKTSDLIGNQSGYTRKKVVDNFIHSVVKVEDELKQNWVDSRLTMACREGFTLVYDEFNRSRPEVNNVLLSALEEKLLVLPPSGNRSEYVRVHPQFRAIFTSNPEEYCGVHGTQDALMDRLVTIDIPEPDEFTQQEILVQKIGLNRESALRIVQLVKTFRVRSGSDKSSGLRSCIILAKVCHEHDLPVALDDVEFRDLCMDVLLSRVALPRPEATALLWKVLQEQALAASTASPDPHLEASFSNFAPNPERVVAGLEVAGLELDRDRALTLEPESPEPEFLEPQSFKLESAQPESLIPPAFSDAIAPTPEVDPLPEPAPEPVPASPIAETTENLPEELVLEPYEREVYTYLQQAANARVSEIESALGISRFQTVNALRALAKKGILVQRDDRISVTPQG